MAATSSAPPDRTINFITGNANKLLEVRAILAPAGVTVTSQSFSDSDLPEVQGTIEAVARDKCRRAAVLVGGPVLVEDTALCFNALGGNLPGVYIKWFLTELGHEGLNRMLDGWEDKGAAAVCTFAYAAGPGEEPILFQGRTEGRIVPARGPGRFGWDPVFEYEGKTYAEMDKDEKNKVSHRGRALEKLKAWMETQKQ